MFQIIPIPNYAGFELRGDSSDFKSLLSAIYYLDNEEYLSRFGYHDPMNYFFGFAYEARYALEGRRGFVCMDNHSKLWNYPNKMKLFPEVPEKNLYYAVRIPAVSLLFYIFVSDEIIALDRRFREEARNDLTERAEKESAEALFQFLSVSVFHALDAMIGMKERIILQECLAFERVNNFYLFRNYLTSYTDLLNEMYLSLTKLRRKRLLSAILKDMICYAKNDTYLQIERNVRAWTQVRKISAGTVKFAGYIDWNKINW